MARPAATISRIALVALVLTVLLLIFSGAPRPTTPAIPAKPNEDKGDVKPTKPTPDSFFHHESTTEPVPSATDSPSTTSDFETSPTAAEPDDEDRPPADASPIADEAPKPPPAACDAIAHANDVMIILKTSSAELFEKVPEQLLTLLSCAPHFAIFSDQPGTIGGHEVHDALKDISPEIRAENKEFKDYDRVLQAGLERQNLGDDLKGDTTKWLDKWKFLPMIYEAYKMHPSLQFYLLVEADTSINWSNLLLWIARLDSRIPYYAGAPMTSGKMKFAQRGSGILLSNAALKLFSNAYEQKYRSRWENQTSKECCGDLMLAKALSDSHVEFYSAFPLLQGESPGSLDWGKRQWCAPVVSWHGVGSGDIDWLWGGMGEWVEEHGWETPYLYRDAFATFISPLLTPRKSDWDNLSSDVKLIKPAESNKDEDNKQYYKLPEETKDATMSADNCEALCEKADDCLQWRFNKYECALGKVVKLGKRVPRGKDGKMEGVYTSGWMLERIRKLHEGWGCEEPAWKFNQ